MIDLIDDGSRFYELKHASGATFRMSQWTLGMQEEVDRSCMTQDGKGGFAWDSVKERELKLKLAVVGWNGVKLNGEEAECTLENKMKLPPGVIFWLIRDVDERAGFRMTDTEKKISS